MISRRPTPILWQQPKRGKSGKTGGSRSRGGSTGPGAYHALTALTQLPRRGAPFSERMGRGELYEHYKRIGMLDVYFALFPGG